MDQQVCGSAWDYARLSKTPGIELVGKFDAQDLTPRIKKKLIKTLRNMNTQAGGYSSKAQAVMHLLRQKFELPEARITSSWLKLEYITEDTWTKVKDMCYALVVAERLEHGHHWALERLQDMIDKTEGDKNKFWFHSYYNNLTDEQVAEIEIMVTESFKKNNLSARFDAAAEFLEQGGTFEFNIRR